jgi:hypothetical protein
MLRNQTQGRASQQRGGEIMLHHERNAHDAQPAYKPGSSGYVSEFTRFIDKFLEEHPEAVEHQRSGWDIFWDHQIDLGELDRADRDKVPIKGYDYF